ncbi:20S proteasome subunit alpha 6 [Paragonimus westermani]|uniref:Proteasome subunit alpha type-1 n=1 Tax=Paragonimus westermani TaxID=34504 RepID=A0A5J4NXV0_9TREM|nr:20S proteasome subunit alpha 6 [Paragonimus westermani]
MFRNQYDHDVTIWSPQGRIHQIEYAMEAVKQGSAAIALKNQDHAIIVALKRAPSELSSYQEKIITIDDHVGVAIAGLTADGRMLSRMMRRECAENRWAYDESLPISRLLSVISLKMQIPTQRYGNRPYGAGMLVAGYDSLGPHVYYLCPSSNAYDCKSIAIGSRSQSARTYLERHLDEINTSSLDDLICHGLKALNGTLPNEVEITTKAYATSTQLYNWHFSPSDLANQRLDCNIAARKKLNAQFPKDDKTANGIGLQDVENLPGLNPDEELTIVKRYIFLMKALFDKFRDPRLPDEKRVRQKEVDSMAIEFGTGETELISELQSEGVGLINLWYQTDLCLMVHPSQFALAVLVELGRTRPRLDVEVFVRDEVCGCDPVQRPKKSPMPSGHESDEDDEKPSMYKSGGKVSVSPSPEERWSQLSDRLDSIREVVSQFDFVVELERMSTEELKLENFRNPLYNIDSEEYAAAKSHADSLLANLE